MAIYPRVRSTIAFEQSEGRSRSELNEARCFSLTRPPPCWGIALVQLQKVHAQKKSLHLDDYPTLMWVRGVGMLVYLCVVELELKRLAAWLARISRVRAQHLQVGEGPGPRHRRLRGAVQRTPRHH